MKLSFSSRLFRGVVVAAVAATVALVLWALGLLETIEYRSWDWRVRYFASREEPSEKVALILLDQQSLDWTNENFGLTWPWPREVYGYLASYMERAGVASYAMDVILSDPSVYSVQDDRQLGAALEALDRDVAALYVGDEEGEETSWPEDLTPPGLSVDGLGALGRDALDALTVGRAMFPIPEVGGNVSMLGNVQVPSDSDGIYRRAPLFNLFDESVVPGLGLASYLVGSGGMADLSLEGGGVRIGDRFVPLDDEGRLILRYKQGGYDAYGAAAILQSELQLLEGSEPAVDPALLAGKHVFFGFSAPGLKDLRPTPLSGSTPGVEIHAVLTDNLLSGDAIREVRDGWVVLFVILSALIAGVGGSYAAGAARTIFLYLLLIPVPVIASGVAYETGSWLPLMVLLIAVVLALVGANVANYATEGRQKRFIKGAFSQYLSPAVIEQLMADPERLRLGGERRDLSIFFSDIQGFTSISETLSPEELTALLNEYLSAMTDIIQEEGGTIDKYEGDAIIAFWNAPVGQEDHGARSVRAALRCQERLAQMRPLFRDRTGKDLFMRIGLNSGPAVVGNMGSKTRFDYTMLGDAVNLAARLEGVNKQFGTYTMVSGATRIAAGEEFRYRELSRIRVVGKNEPVTVFEPLRPSEEERRRRELQLFGAALQRFYQGSFQEARVRFAELAGADPPAARYAAKCELLEQEPPEKWEGVWIMTEK